MTDLGVASFEYLYEYTFSSSVPNCKSIHRVSDGKVYLYIFVTNDDIFYFATLTFDSSSSGKLKLKELSNLS